MDLSVKTLSDITVFSKYARHLPSENRRETWAEICNRYEDMMVKKYPHITEAIVLNMQQVRERKILPSMRAMQFAGPAIERNEARLYNCAYMPVDDYRAFSEAMFLLLGGTGVGYSVQFHHVEKLPAITHPTKERKFVVQDSIEGWADAIKVLMKAYFGLSGTRPVYDLGDIRPKGALLITAGGKAPGPEPLRICLTKIEAMLREKATGSQLTPLEVHDIMCHIANAVLAGGIRRAAMISLFSFDDEEMKTCKFGNWWELNEQRGRANNSAVILRHKVKEEEFYELMDKVEASNAGEPGVYFSNDKDYGTNPCCEIALRPFQFCNLTEVSVNELDSQEDFNHRVSTAAFFGTLQAGFTDFHYLRDIWKRTTEKDALIGVGLTGIASGAVLGLDLQQAALEAKATNEGVAHAIGINPAARVTTVKPSGTTSCVLGTSSGIHAWHNPYYIRRIRVGKNEALYTYLSINHPELIEDDYFRPDSQAVISVPQKAPENAILRTESAEELLERVRKFNVEWVRVGHVSGANTNNVSATISVKPEEWPSVKKWMWENRNTYNGISVLPYDNGSYVQAPFTDCTKEEYDALAVNLHEIDLSKVVEMGDNTDFGQTAACAGGACEIQ